MRNRMVLTAPVIFMVAMIIPLISQAQSLGGRGMRGGFGSSSISIQSSPVPKMDEEKKILEILDDMT